MSEMSGSSLLELLELFESNDIEVWLDGGWAVDAVLGRQTRAHKDVDIEISLDDVPRLQEILGDRGFAVKQGIVPHSFVLANGEGLEVDVHAMRIDESGNGIYRMENGEDWVFTREALSGHGTIGDKTVRCLSAAHQIECHATGYVPSEKDFVDMERIADELGLPLPASLKR